MMAAARARRSPTSFMVPTIARGSLLGRRIGKRLLDDQSEMLVAGLLLLGREQDLDQQPVGRGAIGDDQELRRRGGARVVAGLVRAGGVLLVVQRREEVGEPRDLDPGGA